MLNWILSSSILIVAVLLLRSLFGKRISLRWRYALWGLVLLRLLVPFTVGTSPVSMEAVTRQAVEYSALAGPVISHREPEIHPVDGSETAPQENEHAAPAEPAVQAAPRMELRELLPYVWILGSALMAMAFLYSNRRFSRRLKFAKPLDCPESPVPVYLAEQLETPCLFGLWRPAVYLTPEVCADERTMGHALMHELTHYRHGDHIWSILRCLSLCIHWFNPLVWLAAKLSRRDAELACDEGTIQRLGEGERAGYGRTLIAMTCSKKSNLLSAATTMTASGSELKTRILMIARRPRTAGLALAVTLILALCLMGCSFAGEAVNPHEGKILVAGDGAVTITLSAELPEKIEPLPEVYYSPTEPTGAQVQQVVQTVLGDVEISAGRLGDPVPETRAELEARLAYLRTIPNQIPAELEQLAQRAERAPETVSRTPCSWTFAPVEQIYPDELPSETIPGDEVICGNAHAGELLYHLEATRSDLLQDSLTIGLYAGETMLYERVKYGPEQPTEAQVQAVERKAQDLLTRLGLTDWTAEADMVEYSFRDFTAYCVEVYVRPDRLRQWRPAGQAESRPDGLYQPYIFMVYSNDGVLGVLKMRQPYGEFRETEPRGLSRRALQRCGLEALESLGLEDFPLGGGLDTQVDRCEVDIDRAEYSLILQADPAHPESLHYIPGLVYWGQYRLYEPGEKYPCYKTDFQGEPLAVLDARDGSLLPMHGS